VSAQFAVRILARERPLYASFFDVPLLLPALYFSLSAARWPSSALFPPRSFKPFHDAVLAEILDESVASRRNRRNPRGVKRKMSNFPLRRGYKRSPHIDILAAIQIVK